MSLAVVVVVACRTPRNSTVSSWRGCRVKPTGTAGSHPRSEPCFPTACQHCKRNGSVFWGESRAAGCPRLVSSPWASAQSTATAGQPSFNSYPNSFPWLSTSALTFSAYATGMCSTGSYIIARQFAIPIRGEHRRQWLGSSCGGNIGVHPVCKNHQNRQLWNPCTGIDSRFTHLNRLFVHE